MKTCSFLFSSISTSCALLLSSVACQDYSHITLGLPLKKFQDNKNKKTKITDIKELKLYFNLKFII